MREFYLINAKGERISLNDEKMLLTEPQGLGLEYETTYKKLSVAYKKQSRELLQKTITGVLCFWSYAEYSTFVKFVQSQPLTLEYKANNETYYIDGYMDTLAKGEIEVYLESSFIFKGITNFYKKQTYTITQEAIEDNKQYDYSYPFLYSDISGGSMQYINKTTLEHPARIVINGYAENPRWQLMKNKEVVLTGRINTTVEAGHKLIIDADPLNLEIAEYTKDNEYITNRYGVSDFTTDRFLKFPPGTTELSFSHEADNELKIFVEVREEHESV